MIGLPWLPVGWLGGLKISQLIIIRNNDMRDAAR
jgi:hypothetical protein